MSCIDMGSLDTHENLFHPGPTILTSLHLALASPNMIHFTSSPSVPLGSSYPTTQMDGAHRLRYLNVTKDPIGTPIKYVLILDLNLTKI
ncbi:hypothetical protein DACRYDRAFT_109270 [Dacryopinax primogenitus]|uniref:Uncharacterized protein n=1 Tax=Dacryopinax primogenitus (strain DJM 731) TaxID=1858805 RepID=M5G1T0_DACPD|nr:uncharacterized protein DACRYDRAFT_109270 [Dacryopinax primogenitus]EJT99846.1 hypothetical protein DACRYDRAFT_109270 [Dacryopinax primogenitus]